MKSGICLIAAVVSAMCHGWGLDSALNAVNKAAETAKNASESVGSVNARPVAKQPIVQPIVVNRPVVQQPVVQTPVAQQSVSRQSVVQQSTPGTSHTVGNDVAVLTYKERLEIKNACQKKIRDSYYGKRITDRQYLSFDNELSRFDGARVKMTRKDAEYYRADLEQRLTKAESDLAVEKQALAEKRMAAEKKAVEERRVTARHQNLVSDKKCVGMGKSEEIKAIPAADNGFRKVSLPSQHQGSNDSAVNTKELMDKLDKIVNDYDKDVATCKKIVSGFLAKYTIDPNAAASKFNRIAGQLKGGPATGTSVNVGTEVDNDNLVRVLTDSDIFDYQKLLDSKVANSEIVDFLRNKKSGTFERMEERELKDRLKWYLSCLSVGNERSQASTNSESKEENGVFAMVSSSRIRTEASELLKRIDSDIFQRLEDKVNSAIDKYTESKKISLTFREQMWKERDAAGGSVEKMSGVMKRIADEVAKKEKMKLGRDALIQKLSHAAVSTWMAEVQQYPKGDERDSLVGAVLTSKFGTKADYGQEADAVASLIEKMYSVDEQDQILESNKSSISLVIAIVSSVKDNMRRKKLLLETADWAFHTYRKSSEEENQYAYLVLLSREKDLDVLMSVYEKQDRINFTYDENAKPKKVMSAGDCLEKMMTDHANSNGAGYGRLGLWMLDHCGPEFCQRVRRLTNARRQVAKTQTFLMKKFYLGMPHRDSRLLMKDWDKDKGRVSAQFGAFNNRTLSSISFGATARVEYLGITKDGLTGLGAFVEKYIPGGLDGVGELKVGAQSDLDPDPENPDVKIKTWWYVNCPKYKCRIRMYDSGTINVVYTGSDDYPTLDFTQAEKHLNDADDDDDDQDSSGCLFKYVVLLAIVGTGLYLFRKKIDAFVVAHPKYTKAWSVTCLMGNKAREYGLRGYEFAKAKVAEAKSRKSK